LYHLTVFSVLEVILHLIFLILIILLCVRLFQILAVQLVLIVLDILKSDGMVLMLILTYLAIIRREGYYGIREVNISISVNES